MKSDRGSIIKKRTVFITSIIIISIAGAITVYFTTLNSFRKNFVNDYIRAKTKTMTGEFTDRTERLENSISLFAKWGQNGLINLEDTASFERAFIPVLTDAKSIYSITIIENNGKEYEITKKDSVYESTFYFPEKKEILRKIINREGKVIENKKTHKEFFETQKYWLPENSSDSNFRWLGPVIYKGKEVVSISSSWKNNDSTQVYITIHVLLKDFFKAFSNAEINDNEYLFLLNHFGDVYNVLGYEGFVDKQFQSQFSMHPYYRVKVPQIAKAVEFWVSNNKDTTNVLEFKIKNATYWAKFVSIKDNESKYLLGIVVSGKLINSKIGEKYLQIILYSIVIILIGLIFIILVFIRTNKKLRELQKPEIRKNNVQEDILKLAQKPESKTLEFKSTIRYNLHTGKKDKALEYAWLKGVAAFLNTDGGILLIGVSDDGSFIGIENDDFENEDKALLHIKNLISKNIGLEFMKFVSMFTAEIEGKQIIALQCKQSTKPAYLKNNGEEHFYVRVGPSSTKLSLPQAVEHIYTHGYKRIVTVN